MIYNFKIAGFSYLILLFTGNISCKKFLEVPAPKSSIISDRVFENDVTANAAVLGMYAAFRDPQSFANGTLKSVTMVAGLSSDELIKKQLIGDNVTPQFLDNAILPENPYVLSLWTSMYAVIYMSNGIIEGLSVSTSVDPELKDRLMGEALFVRAFCHFYLVNLFGKVPIVMSTDYKVNAILGKSPEEKVYQQIIEDLRKATSLLNDSYDKNERVRPVKATAHALLARTYLYTGNWTGAKLESDSVINTSSQYRLVSLDSVFLKNSNEAIWQLSPVSIGNTGTTDEAYHFLPPNVLSFNILNPELFAAFEDEDSRRNKWVGIYTTGGIIYYPYKYRQNKLDIPASEYSMILRLGEQYLIRAEARTHLQDHDGAREDINAIRGRASLSNTTGNSESALLTAIEHERRVELFTEWGHRWFDLKRTSRANTVLGSKKSKWNPEDVLYPVPQLELNTNHNLLPQNSGY